MASAIDRAALLQGAAQRRARYLSAAAAAAQTWYDVDGTWATPTPAAHARERLWACFALYSGTPEQVRLADAVVSTTRVESFADGHRFNIFTSNIAPILYAKHRERMGTAARELLLDLTREGHHNLPGDRQPDYQFHGYNDNMPAKGTMGLIVGGELIGDDSAVAHGLWQLRQFKDELTRNGVNSEYTSPTYSALTLHAMGAIREFSTCAAAVGLAKRIERRLWADIACHWHAPSRQLAGPHSRAYTRDHIGQNSNVRSVLWVTLGERVTGISPMLYFEQPDWLVLHHAGDLPFNIASACWFVCGDYRIDEDLAELLLCKPQRFECVATAEHGDYRGLPTRRVRCATHMTNDCSLGTVSKPFCGGEQTDSFFVTSTHEDSIVGSTIYVKYAVNHERPGTLEHAPGCCGEMDQQIHRALNVVLHDGPAAIFSCRPHDDVASEPVDRLGLQVILGTHLHCVDELRIGGREVTEWAGEFDARQWFGLRRGRCYLAVRPLAYTVDGPEAAIRLRTFERYRVLSIDNYLGEPQRFAVEGLHRVLNGFAAEIAGVSEFGSLREFMETLYDARFEDYFLAETRRMRYVRPAGRGREAVDMALCYSTKGLQERYATSCGRELPCEAWSATGLPAEELPFLTEPFEPRPLGIPWNDLGVCWQNWPWHIHEPGR